MSLLLSYSDSEPSVSEVGSGSRSSIDIPTNPPPSRRSRRERRAKRDRDHIPDFTGKTIHVLRQGPLTLREKIGEGGYGSVYRASLWGCTDEPDKEYAVKILSRATAVKYGSLETSVHEAVSGHPNIVKFHEMVIADPYIFIVMDYHSGGDLRDAFTESGVFANNSALIKSIFLQLIDAVEHCHSKGVFHRDLKLENILCSPDFKEVYLTDFGLATTEEEIKGFGVGTRSFRSPECLGMRAHHSTMYNTRQSDVFSLGIILFILVTHTYPWAEASINDSQYRTFVRDNRHLFSTYPITYPLFCIFCKVFAPYEKRMTLAELKEAIRNLDEFFPGKEDLGRCSPASRRLLKRYAGGSEFWEIDTTSGFDLYRPNAARKHQPVAARSSAEQKEYVLGSCGTSAEPPVDRRVQVEQEDDPLPPTRSSSTKDSKGPITPEVAPAAPGKVAAKTGVEVVYSTNIPFMCLDHLPNKLVGVVGGRAALTVC